MYAVAMNLRKCQSFEEIKEPYLSTVTKWLQLIKTEWQERIFNRTYQDVDNVADALKTKEQK